MYDYVNDAQYACDRHNEAVRKVEERSYIPSLQPKQPNMLTKVYDKITEWEHIFNQQQPDHAKSTRSKYHVTIND